MIAASGGAAAAGQPSAGSVLDGVFTAAQASRGERTFREVCAACHDTGEFSGGRFRIGWVGRPVGELFETISTLMPEADPGSLSRGQYAAIVAYLLQLNDYPAGDVDLPTNGRALGQLGDSRAAGAVGAFAAEVRASDASETSDASVRSR